MNILVLNGSPKKKSDTMCLTNSFLAGLKAAAIASSAETDLHLKIINVIEKRINPCLGCFGCWQKNDARCVQNDDLNSILEDIIACDVMVWSFPLYCYGMPSHLKAVLDRMIPLIKMSMRMEPDGRVVHETLVDLTTKKFVVIVGCGFPNWEGNFEPLIGQCRNFFGSNLTMLCIPETPMLNVPQAQPLTAPLLSKMSDAGGEFYRDGSLSSDTVAAVQMPMMPNEQYVQVVNTQA